MIAQKRKLFFSNLVRIAHPTRAMPGMSSWLSAVNMAMVMAE